MIHESIKVKHFTVKDNPGFRVRVEQWEVISPKGLYSLNFIQESLKDNGTVRDSQIYNFFMTKEEIKTLTQGLLSE
jgi:hypothetical protein